MYAFLLIVMILVCLILVVTVLLQAGTGGGLAAMGGGASTDSFLGGRQATTILTKATWWLGGIFLVLAMILAGMSTRSSAPRSVLEGQQPTIPAPIAPPVQLPLETAGDEGGSGETGNQNPGN